MKSKPSQPTGLTPAAIALLGQLDDERVVGLMQLMSSPMMGVDVDGPMPPMSRLLTPTQFAIHKRLKAEPRVTKETASSRRKHALWVLWDFMSPKAARRILEVMWCYVAESDMGHPALRSVRRHANLATRNEFRKKQPQRTR